MALNENGKLSIGDIRSELQNTGNNNFSLKKAGVPTTTQNPQYTPLNLSSSNLPQDSAPYSLSEWRKYNHSENLPCLGENIIVTYENDTNYGGLQTSVLRKYDFANNQFDFLEDFGTVNRYNIAITRNKLFTNDGTTIRSYDITLSPWYLSSSPETVVDDTPFFGLVAKDDNTIVGWYHDSGDFYVNQLTRTSPTTYVIDNLFILDGNLYNLDYNGSQIYYDAINDVYLVPYYSGLFGDADPPYYVGKFAADPNNYSYPITSIDTGTTRIISVFEDSSNFYGIGNPDLPPDTVFLLDFNTQTISFNNFLSINFTSLGQSKPPLSSFTSPTLGTFYTYYRVKLRGDANESVEFEVTGNGTTNHWCYIYNSYPFNNVGELTGSAWTYSNFTSATTRTFTRTLSSTSETHHIVLFQGS